MTFHLQPQESVHDMHALLERQLRRAGFSRDLLPIDLITWQEFLSRVERSYINADRERTLLQQQSIESLPIDSTLQWVSPSDMNSLRLQTLMAAIQDGICAFDCKGHLLFINSAAENYLETEYQQLQQISVLERFIVHDRDAPETCLSTATLLERLAQGQSFCDNNALLSQKNHQLAVSFELNPIIEDGKVVALVLLFHDITEMKGVEAELRSAKDAAEKASHAKSQFLSSMSHELRTPMNAILGYGELIKEDLGEPIDSFDEDYVENMLQYVNNILQAGWHLLELINKVLDLSRIEAGKLEVTIEPVELIDLIKECTSLIAPLAEKRAIVLQNNTATSTPRFALADRARLKQVIVNLLSNAVKYNREAGTIIINLSQEKREYIRLEITDTGLGFTAEQKEQIFEPFTRLSGVNVVEGTGIGLTITKRLLEIMDGQIGVDSVIDVGSTFWVELPSGEMIDAEISTSNHKYILLYVEDSRTNVSLVAQILKARPHIALMSAHTGEMGLELANMHKPDIILLDINLPGMDGFEVLDHLRASQHTSDIPVLALSAIDSARNKERGKEAGFLNYIVKPLDIKQFLTAIDYALEFSPRNKHAAEQS